MNEETALPILPSSRFRDRELWVGVFVLLGVAAILIALLSLTDAALFRGRYIVQTVVPDAGGIRKGDPVQMLGVNIGRVTHFQIGTEEVRVSLEIKGEYPIPADSQVELRSSGLLGGMVANVVPGSSTVLAGWNDVLSGSVEEGIFDQIDDLQQEANMALVRVQKLLSEQMIQNIHEGSDDLQKLLRGLHEMTAEQRGELAALTQSLRRSADMLEETIARPEVDRSVKRIDAIISKLDSMTTPLGHTIGSLENILSHVDHGKGSLGKLVHDEALYDNLSASAASVKNAADALANLAEDVRAQPKKYVRLSLF